MNRRILVRLFLTAAIIILIWATLTVWVEKNGPAKIWHFANAGSQKLLVVYDPDPIYNLDQQICQSLGRGVSSNNNIDVTIATVAASKDLDLDSFDSFVICANTYNWMPDWATSRFVRSTKALNHKRVAAITLGAGSTVHSQKALEKMIEETGGELIESQSLWLLRPNDDAQMEKGNVQVALAKAYYIGKHLQLNN
ncbi:MAG: hypothetical protein ABJA70_07280 [Chryseolinea sp.]